MNACGDDDLPGRLAHVLHPVARPNPAVIAWRWRYELGLVAALGAAAWAITHFRVSMWTLMFGWHFVITVCLTPGVRRVLARRTWCVIVPHRVRRGCAEARLVTRHGKLPIILWTSATGDGQRVLLYCRAGVTAEHFRAARDVLRGACWASDVLVHDDPGSPHLVTLDIVRR